MSDFVTLNDDKIFVNLDNISFIEWFTKKNEEDKEERSHAHVYFINSDKYLILSYSDANKLEEDLFESGKVKKPSIKDDHGTNNSDDNSNNNDSNNGDNPEDESGIEYDPVVK